MMKVKRSKNIYRPRRRISRSPIITILLIIGAALLIFIGWSIAGPVQKFLTGNLKPTTKNKTSAVTAVVNSSATPSKKSVSSAAVTTFGSGSVKGIYLPENYLSDTSSLGSIISSAKTAGINMAVVNLKGEDGILKYNSKNQDAVSGGLVASGAPDCTIAATKLKNAGITPCARICCFKDPAASDAMREAAVAYSGNHGYRWLDASNKSWLNPYSDKAQQYIISIAKEAVSQGYPYILLDGIEFPSTGSPQTSAWYGNTTVSKENMLRTFVATATQQINAAGGKVILHMPAPAAIGTANALTGQDQSLFGFNADYISPDLCPSDFGTNSFTAGSKTIANPVANLGDTVQAVSQLLASQAGETKIKTAVPYLQAFSDGGSSPNAASDVNSQLTAIKSAGITSFILYNPKGNYNFSGINLK